MHIAESANTGGSEQRPRLPFDVMSKTITSLVDTGATMCCVREALAKRIPKGAIVQHFPPPQELASVKNASGNVMACKGVLLLRIWVEGLHFRTWPFAVFDKLQSECIIGDDFLRAHRARIDRGYDVMGKIEWRTPQEEEAVTLLTREAIWIPPRTAQRVHTYPKWKGRTPFKLGIVTSDRISCVEGIQEVTRRGQSSKATEEEEEEKVTIVVLNQQDRPMSVGRNVELATLTKLEKEDQISSIEEIQQQNREEEIVNEPLTEKKRKFIDATVNLKCPEKYRQDYMNMLYAHHEAIAEDEFDIGKCGAVKHDIHLKHKNPVHIKQYRIPFAHRDFVTQYVDQLLKKGVIEWSKSPYNSPLFCVKKQHKQGLRLVQDLRALNEATYEDRYSFREVQDCVDEVGKRRSTVFSSLDFLSGYWQQEMTERSREPTAFTVPGKGRFHWTRTVMGLAGSPSSFSRLMEEVFRGIEGVITYLDDCLTHSRDHKEHLKDVEECLIRCKMHKLKLNLAKCTLGAKEVPYLGFVLSEKGVTPGKEKTEAIENFEAPSSVPKIRQFCGLANYFRHMIPNFATYSGELTQLTQKTSTWRGGKLPEEAQRAFEHLKKALTSSPVLATPRRDRNFILATDAAAGGQGRPGGYGAVLTQKDDSGQERAVAYASRTLKTHEKNYSAYVLEMAAAVWAIEHFHVYLYDTRFILLTDHKPMEKLSTVHKKTLLRLQELMGKYNFELRYRPGKDNGPADALSRNARRPTTTTLEASPISVLEITPTELASKQQEDETGQDLRQALQEKKSIKPRRMGQQAFNTLKEKCTLQEGVIVQKTTGRPTKIYVPEGMRYELLRAAHTSRFGGHTGTAKTTSRVSQRYFWPNMNKDIEEWVKACAVCQEQKTGNPHRQKELLQPLVAPTEPNWRVHLDLFGPLRQTPRGKKMVLVITDAFSKLAEVVPIENKTAETVALAFFSTWICRYGCPRQIITDGGKEFCSKITENLCRYLEVDHNVTTAYHPQSNSGAESFNREIIRYLSCMMDNADQDWEAWLPSLMLAYNTRIHRATKNSPFYLTYLRDPNLPYFMLEMDRALYGEDWATTAAQRLKVVYKMTRENLLRAAEENKRQYNKTARKQETFEAGETTMVHFPKTSFGKENLKFVRPWVKFTVVKALGNDAYEVRKWGDEGKQYTSRVHVNRMKKYYSPNFQLKADKNKDLPPPRQDDNDYGAEWDDLSPEEEEVPPQGQEEEDDDQGQHEAAGGEQEEQPPERPDRRARRNREKQQEQEGVPDLPIARATRSHHPELKGTGKLPETPLEYRPRR